MMSLRVTVPCFRSALAACALLTVLCPSPASADTPAVQARPTAAKVGELFDQAQAAFAKGDKETAYRLYKEAWALQKSYDIAGNLGNVELKLGKYRDASEHLEYALGNFPPTGETAAQQALTKKLDEARKEIGRVQIRVNVAGARVFVNGRLVGVSPLADEVYVEPTGCTIEAKLEGYTDGHESASPGRGSSKSVTLVLVAEPRGPSTALLVTGSALTAASLAVGIGLTVAANAKSDDVDTLGGQVPGRSVCAGSGAPSVCADLRSAAGSRDSLSNAAAVSFLVGGAFALTTAGLGISRATVPKTTASVRVAPVIAAGQGGVMILGSW